MDDKSTGRPDYGTDFPDGPAEAKAFEVKAFTNVIRSFYNQQLNIDGPDDLNRMTEIAEFFGCLPIVSHGLDATIAKGTNNHEERYLDNIPPWDGSLIIGSAETLRNASLFRECVILCAGQWIDDPDYHEKSFRNGPSTGHLLGIIHPIHEMISCDIARLHWFLINRTTSRENDDSKVKDEKAIWRRTMELTAEKLMNIPNGKLMPEVIPAANYYRSLHDEEFGPFGCRYIRGKLKDILENRLPLNRRAVAGEGRFKEHLIYHEFWDDDLPWDVKGTSMDW
jgi:hypothetical protein